MEDSASAKRVRREEIMGPAKCYVGRLAPSPTGMMHLGHANTFCIAMQRAMAHQKAYEEQQQYILSQQRQGLPLTLQGCLLGPATLIFRVEDIDVGRCREHFLVDIVQDLHWLGLEWDRGPGCRAEQRTGADWTMDRCAERAHTGVDGNSTVSIHDVTSSYFQSRRGQIYEAALQLLRRYRYVYACKHSRRQIAAEMLLLNSEAASASNVANEEKLDDYVSPQSAPNEGDYDPIFPLSLRPAEGEGEGEDMAWPAAAEVNWRFRVPDDGAPITFHDGSCGHCTFTPLEHFGDFLVFSNQGYATYEMAVVVDDALMGVSEVVRGKDLLVSTARQLLLLRALRDCCRQERAAGREPGLFPASLMEAEPKYYHCPLLRDAEGKRMSKRRGSATLRAHREAGKSPTQVREACYPAIGDAGEQRGAEAAA